MIFADLFSFDETMRLVSIMSDVYALSLPAVQHRFWSVSPKAAVAIGMKVFALS